MRYSSRLFLYAPLLVLLTLAIAAALRWEAVADGLEAWFRQSNGHEIAPGVTLHFATESISGFPFNVDVALRDVTFQVKSAHTSGSWHTDAFAIHELTFGRSHQIYEAAGKQTVLWSDAEGDRHHLTFVPGSLMASAILSHGRLVRFDLDLNGIGSREISGTRAQLHFRKAPDRDAIDIVISADQLHLDSRLQAGFGTTIRRALLEASVTPAAPFAPLFDGRDTWDRALDTWRHNDGVFHITGLDTDWGGVQIHARGTLGLDRVHRPRAALGLNIGGAMNLRPSETGENRLAHAIEQSIKSSDNAPGELLLSIESGDVNVRATKAPQIATGAGLIGPLY